MGEGCMKMLNEREWWVKTHVNIYRIECMCSCRVEVL